MFSHESWLWLGGSLVIAVFWSGLAWFFRRPRSGILGEAVTPLITWRFSPPLFQVGRLLYYLGIPFAGLLWGRDAVIGRNLGVQPLKLPVSNATDAAIHPNWLDWAHDLGWAAVLGTGTLVILIVGWWTYRRALIKAGEKGTVTAAHVSAWTTLREATYHEVHWAFYRNAPMMAWGAYWGSWAGLALVALEAALNPAWWQGMDDPQRTPGQLVRSGLAFVSSALFLLTQNLWLAILLHWSVSWGIMSLYHTQPRPEGTSSSHAHLSSPRKSETSSQ
jgi:hypothetical protein